MTKEIRQVEVTLTEGGKLSGNCRHNTPISIDYAGPEGYSPMELLLVSLASCSGATVISILQKKRKTVSGFKISAQGIKAEAPPGAYEQIYLDFDLCSSDASPADLERSIQLAEEKYCPVWAMLKGNVAVTTTYQVRMEE